MYNLTKLGEYSKDFLLVKDAIRDTIKEFAGNQVGSVEIKEEDGKVVYDQEQFIASCQNVHTVRERADTLTALYYDGFLLLAEQEANSNELEDERVDEAGEETV